MKNNNQVWVWVAVVIVAAIAGWFWWKQQNQVSLPVSDTTTSINKDLSAVDLGNVDKEIQSTDADVNAL